MYRPDEYYQQSVDYIDGLIHGLTETHEHVTPSQWAETKRYLPRQNSPQPGPYSFAATPYWREVLDCLDPDHPCRFLAVKKGAQVGATVGILENAIGYLIEHVRSAPGMFATADAELTKQRIETNIVPMLQNSNLEHLIQSSDEGNNRKQGRTSRRIDWAGGGFLLPFGALSPSKMRSFSVSWLLRDEVSGWPLAVGRDGDPMKLTETRTNSFESTRKVLDLSTPLETATDVITKRFELGDKRYYNVPCKHCHAMQVLKFRDLDPKTGIQGGLIWDTTMIDGVKCVVPGSVRYVCKHCGGEMINEDKVRIMPLGKWVPTTTPRRPNFRSYHLSAMYAPHFARTWEAIASAWVEAWDDETNTPNDLEALQVFYNNDLGEAFEVKADKLKSHQVSAHRRRDYRLGELPGDHAIENSGGPLEVITMAVDVQGSWLSVGISAWSPSADRAGYNSYLVEYFNIEGDTSSPDAEAWSKLAAIIDSKTYKHNGRVYPVAVTMVDASYETDTVYEFCSQWDAGVYPLRGRDKPLKAARIKEFDTLENATGVRYAAVTVDLYKDRWASALRRTWNGVDALPRNAWSAPVDLPDKAINELAVEYKREKKDPQSGKLLGTYWHRPGNARQELWDLLVYSTAALEMIAHDVCSQNLGFDALIWPAFWEYVSDGVFWDQEV